MTLQRLSKLFRTAWTVTQPVYHLRYRAESVKADWRERLVEILASLKTESRVTANTVSFGKLYLWMPPGGEYAYLQCLTDCTVRVQEHDGFCAIEWDARSVTFRSIQIGMLCIVGISLAVLCLVAITSRPHIVAIPAALLMGLFVLVCFAGVSLLAGFLMGDAIRKVTEREIADGPLSVLPVSTQSS
jgi:hypothetical protein